MNGPQHRKTGNIFAEKGAWCAKWLALHIPHFGAKTSSLGQPALGTQIDVISEELEPGLHDAKVTDGYMLIDPRGGPRDVCSRMREVAPLQVGWPRVRVTRAPEAFSLLVGRLMALTSPKPRSTAGAATTPPESTGTRAPDLKVQGGHRASWPVTPGRRTRWPRTFRNRSS